MLIVLAVALNTLSVSALPEVENSVADDVVVGLIVSIAGW